MSSLLIGGVKYLGTQFFMNKISNTFSSDDNSSNYSTTVILATIVIALLLYVTKGNSTLITDTVMNVLKTDVYAPDSVIIHNQEGSSNEINNLKNEEKLKLLADTNKLVNALDAIPVIKPLEINMKNKLPMDVLNYSKEVYFPHQMAIIEQTHKLAKLELEGELNIFKKIEKRKKDNLIEEYRLNKIMMSNIMADLIVKYQQNGIKDHLFEKFIKWFNDNQKKIDNSSKEIKCLAICN